ncbi:MAG TPA: OmpH family outer membrane protein [Desulfuromonadaceae bacterium]|nr:OmpH family outer membrane protein [Desulfuromonadaceae bacterium]
MKNVLKLILPAILLIAFSIAPASAQGKIGTVDLSKLFKNYYKTKLAQSALDDRKAQVDKDLAGMADDLKKGDGEYKSLLTAANDQALSQDERDKKKVAADAKLKQLQESKAAFDQYQRSAGANLNDQFQRMREKILDEVQAAVAAKAKTDGYALILDSASQSANVTPVIVYNNGQMDLTEVVLKQLNAGAPIDLSPTNAMMSAPTPPMVKTNRF